MSTSRKPHILRRNTTLRNLFAGSAISLIGSEITMLAIPLMALTELDATTLQVAVIGALEFVPFLILGLLAGALMDRRRRRPVMILTDVGRALTLTSIPVAWWLGVLSMSHVYVVVLMVGAMTLFFDVSAGSFLPDVVDEDDLIAANSAYTLAETAGLTAGNAVAGGLVAAVGAPIAVLTDAVSYLASAFFITRVPKEAEWPPEPTAKGSAIRAEIVRGMTFVRGHDELRPILLAVALQNAFMFAFYGVLLTFAVRDAGFSALRVGLAFGLGNIGTVLGSIFSDRLVDRFRLGPVLCLSPLLIGIGYLLIPLAPSNLVFPAMVLGMTIAGAGSTIGNILQISYRTAVTPPALRSRMNATFRVALYGAIPIGSIAGGIVATNTSHRLVLTVSAIGLAIPSLIMARSMVRRIVALPNNRSELGLVEARGDERLAKVGTPTSEVGALDRRSRGGERKLPDVYRWDDMKVHVWDLIPRNDDPDAITGEDALLREADALARHYEMLGQDLGHIDPMVDLGPRHDQGVTGSHRVNGEEPDAEVVLPNE